MGTAVVGEGKVVGPRVVGGGLGEVVGTRIVGEESGTFVGDAVSERSTGEGLRGGGEDPFSRCSTGDRFWLEVAGMAGWGPGICSHAERDGVRRCGGLPVPVMP